MATNSQMLFEFQGVTYFLEFERESLPPKEKKNLPRELKPLTPGAKPVASQRTTTAKLWRRTAIDKTYYQEIIHKASASCHHKDKFTLEGGRVAALRALSILLSREFRTAVWKAYHDRLLPDVPIKERLMD